MIVPSYAVIGQPAAVTLPTLVEAGFHRALGTIFVQRRVPAGEQQADGPWCYDTPEEAHVACWRQVEIYRLWEREGRIRLAPTTAPRQGETAIELTLLMEGAAGVRSVDELRAFHAAGVRVIGLTWSDGTRWAGGNESGGDITPEGRMLVAEIERLGMVHDVSHLSERAFYTLLEIARRPKIASHSNCRALLPGRENNERNLTDKQIQSLIAAGGMIGVNLFTNFLAMGRRATIDDVVRHIRRIVELAGRADIVGLGSDMDGGFGPAQLPMGLEHPRKLHRLAEALSDAGFSDEAVAGFAWANWTRFFDRALP